MSEGKKLFVTFYPDEGKIEFFFGGEVKSYTIEDYSGVYPGKFKFGVKDLFMGEEYEYVLEYRDLNVNGIKELLKNMLDQTGKTLELLLGKSVTVEGVVYEEERDEDLDYRGTE
jgi:hypothetical protein